MQADESRAPRGPGFLLSWAAAILAVGAAGVVLWTLASPKPAYDAWWESQRLAPGELTHEDLARTRSGVYRVQSLRAIFRGDSLIVHPRITGELTGSYTYSAELTLGFNNLAIVSEEGWVRLPDDLAQLDFGFRLAELDSAFAVGKKDSLRYQVRFRLNPGTMLDPKARKAVQTGPSYGSTAFLAATYYGR